MDFLDTLFEGMNVQARRDNAASPFRSALSESHGRVYGEEGVLPGLNESNSGDEEGVEGEEVVENEGDVGEQEIDNFENDLCNLCRAIDWRFILSGIQTPGRTVRDYRVHVSVKLHSFHTMQVNAPFCSFCRLVALAPNAALEEDHFDSPLILWYTNRAPWRLERIEGDHDYEPDPEEKDGFRLLICDFKDYFPYHRTCEEGARIPIMVHQDDIPAERKDMSGKLIAAEVDMDLVREWWRCCNAYHQGVCWTEDDKDRNELPHAMRVIDVRNNTLVEAPRDCRYVALSYVWGKVQTYLLAKEQATTLASMSGGLILPVEELPLTIRDAMEAVRAIGECYLWVDSVCIAQDDLEEKRDTIARMGYVYKCAALTIIAAAGDDANAGLYGLASSPRYAAQVFEKVDGITLIHCGKTMLQTLRGSKWNTRAWTLQEDYFGQRKLVFTAEQVFYQCKACNWRESQVNVDLERVISTLAKDWMSGWDPSKFTKSVLVCVAAHNTTGVNHDLNKDTNWSAYTKIVDRFSCRELSWESDVLNAFAGISASFSKKMACDFAWGLPLQYFDYALLWRPRHCSEFAVESLDIWNQPKQHGAESEEDQRDKIEPGFVRRLAAIPEKQNKLLFPTWSFIGWVGAVTLRGHDRSLPRIRTCISWPWDKQIRQTFPERYPELLEEGILAFDAEVAHIDHLFVDSLREDELAHVEWYTDDGGAPFFGRTLECVKIATAGLEHAHHRSAKLMEAQVPLESWAQIDADDTGMIRSITSRPDVDELEQYSMKQARIAFPNELPEYEGFFIGMDIPIWWYYVYVMVLHRERDGTATRRGLVLLHMRDWVAAAPKVELVRLG